MTTERSDPAERHAGDDQERIPTRDGGRRSRAGSTYGDYTPPAGRERGDDVNPMGDYYTGGTAGAGREARDVPGSDADDAAPVVPTEGDERPLRSEEAGHADGSRRR